MRLLKLPHGVYRGIVPLTVRGSAKRAIFAQCRLNLGNPVRRRRLLPALPYARLFCGFAVMSTRGAMFCRGRGRIARFRRIALGPCDRAIAYTYSVSDQTRHRQTTRCKHSHSPKERGGVSASPSQMIYCWPSAVGTTPDKYTVNIRSLSCRRRTLKTTFCPGFSLLTALR
jgi:hypothetical protein